MSMIDQEWSAEDEAKWIAEDERACHFCDVLDGHDADCRWAKSQVHVCDQWCSAPGGHAA